MFSSLNEIVEGWRNDLFPPEKLKEIIIKVSGERMAICKSCIAYDITGIGCSVPFTQPCCNNNITLENGEKGCGCPLRKKTKSLSSECPAKKWKAIITSEEQEQFKLSDNGK